MGRNIARGWEASEVIARAGFRSSGRLPFPTLGPALTDSLRESASAKVGHLKDFALFVVLVAQMRLAVFHGHRHALNVDLLDVGTHIERIAVGYN